MVTTSIVKYLATCTWPTGRSGSANGSGRPQPRQGDTPPVTVAHDLLLGGGLSTDTPPVTNVAYQE